MSERIRRWLTVDEVNSLFTQFCGKSAGSIEDLLRYYQFKLIVGLGVESGLRVSEMTRLRWEDVDGDKARIVGKGGKIANVRLGKMTKTALHYLNDLDPNEGRYQTPEARHLIPKVRNDFGRITLDWSGMTPRAVQHILKPYNLAPHDLRRTFCKQVYESTGRNLGVTSVAMRHSNLATTRIYLEGDENRTYDAIPNDLGF